VLDVAAEAATYKAKSKAEAKPKAKLADSSQKVLAKLR
jgi:hypothetical protein